LAVESQPLSHTMKQTNNSTHIQEILTHLRSVHGSVPLHRRESKRKYSFSGLPFATQLAIWDELWHTENNFWTRLHAYFFLERHCTKEAWLKEMWPVIVHWQDQVDDWGLCDALAKIYTKILVAEPQKVYDQLKAWNTDKDLWKRRQSVVSLLYYSRTKKQHPSFIQIKQLLVPLLGDKEYYVQKGVGWTLRELRNVYPNETLAWLKQDIKLISAVAFTIAIEKLDKTNIDELKAIRKSK
jgi:3-methyladenine DNA glycosylase AlkD